MYKRREVTGTEFFGALFVLAGLIISLGAPFGARAEAEENRTFPETVSADAAEFRKNDYGKMPVLFEQNQGQTGKATKFVSRQSGYTLFLTETEAVFQLRISDSGFRNEKENPKTKREKTKTDVLKMKFAGANPKPQIEGEAEAVTKTNYYIGKNRFENVSNYRRVNYRNLYDGIDAVFYGNAKNQLEYDFNVAPNADPNKIRLNFDGAQNLSIDAGGNLVIKTENAELVQQKPFAYQIIGGEKRAVEVKYFINEKSEIRNPKSEIGFALGAYDRNLPLVIDPVLDYLTYLGGSAVDRADSIKVDAAGNAYIVGATSSLDFPTPNSRNNGTFAVFVSKIDPDGANVLYTTFLDGDDEDGIAIAFDIGFRKNDIAIDASGNAYIAGLTASRDFPVTANAYQTVLQCERSFGFCIITEEAFVTKLNAQGAIVYSTFLGGKQHDFASGIAVDSSGRAYVTGTTASGLTFPTKNAYQGTGIFASATNDAFLTVFNAAGSDIIYSTGLGGNEDDFAFDIALDAANNAYITGETDSSNLPTKNAAQAAKSSGFDAFVAKFNPFQSGEASLVYSTFLGGGGTDKGLGIAVAGSTTTVTGVTGSTNFPLLNAFDTTNQVNEAFITQYNSSGTMLNSTFLGGADQDEGTDVAPGSGGTIFVTGSTLSSNFPLALPFQSTLRGQRDAFVVKVRFGTNNNPGVSSASYLGGVGSDQGRGIAVRGNFIFLVGSTASNNLLTTGGVIKPTSGANATNTDGFVAKILDTRLDSVGVFRPASTFILTQSIANVVPSTVNQTTSLAGELGVAGDWNGDGVDTIGSFTDGVWKYRNSNFVTGYATTPVSVNFGSPGDLPIAGDWNNDGIDTPGVYRPSTGQFFLTNSTAANPPVDVTVVFGIGEDLPVAGDWNADGFDSVGVFRPSAGQFFLTDDNVLTPNIDQTIFFGISGDLPTAGDWNGNGVDTVGVYRPSTTEFFLTNDNVNISNVFLFGQINTDQPIAGDWDGRPLP